MSALLASSLGLGAVVTALSDAPGPVPIALTIAAVALLGVRVRGPAAQPHRPAALLPHSGRAGQLDARLRQLHLDHVEQVNMALSEGREDLVRQLSDSYLDQSLSLITAPAGAVG